MIFKYRQVTHLLDEELRPEERAIRRVVTIDADWDAARFKAAVEAIDWEEVFEPSPWDDEIWPLE